MPLKIKPGPLEPKNNVPIGIALRDLKEGEFFTIYVLPGGILRSDTIEFFEPVKKEIYNK